MAAISISLSYVIVSNISLIDDFSSALSSLPLATRSAPFNVKSDPGIGIVPNFDLIKPRTSVDKARENCLIQFLPMLLTFVYSRFPKGI